MKRIPEKEVMDDLANAQAYAAADFSEPHNFFISKFLEKFPYPNHFKQVIDPGCGSCDVTMRFANAVKQCAIDAFDASPPMLQLADVAIKKQGLTDRISLSHLYLDAFTTFAAHYELLISNSLLHHLHSANYLWQAIHKVLLPGGAVFIMDLARPASIEAALVLTEKYAANEPEVLRQDFYHSLLAAYTVEEVEMQLRENDLQQLSVEMVTDRHFIVYGTL